MVSTQLAHVLSTFLVVDGIRVLKKQCLDLGVALCRAGPTTLAALATGDRNTGTTAHLLLILILILILSAKWIQK